MDTKILRVAMLVCVLSTGCVVVVGQQKRAEWEGALQKRARLS